MIGRPGTLVSVPPEIVHAFANTSHVTATMLLMFCPADAREKYFEGLAELTKDGREPEHHEIVALMRRFDSSRWKASRFRDTSLTALKPLHSR